MQSHPHQTGPATGTGLRCPRGLSSNAVVVFCLTAALGPSAWGAPAAASSVTSVRHWSQGSSTRVAVELSAKAKWRSERITNPARLFIDLSDTRMALGVKGIYTMKVGDALLRQVRVANPNPQTTRIVLDLEEEDVDFEVSELTNPVRLMIEVRAKDSSKVTRVAPAKPEPPAKVASVERPEAQSQPTASTEPLPKPDVVLYKSVPESPAPAPAIPAEATPPTSAQPAPPPPAAGPIAAAPKPAKPTTSAGKPSLTRALGLKLGRIVIDPGHGGQDQGTAGVSGLLEKDLVLDIAQRLGALVEQRMGSSVLYTRTEDVFIPLEERTAFANQHRADLFISIHANSSPLRSASGAEVFFLNFTTSKDALEVAARENAGHGKSIFELREIIQKIALKDKVDESRDFAGKVQNSLHSTWTRMNPNSRNRGVKQAPFIVLIGANMPSILAEIGFLSNARDESMLKKPEHRQRIAEALFRGISNYADTLSRMDVARTGAAQN